MAVVPWFRGVSWITGPDLELLGESPSQQRVDRQSLLDYGTGTGVSKGSAVVGLGPLLHRGLLGCTESYGDEVPRSSFPFVQRAGWTGSFETGSLALVFPSWSDEVDVRTNRLGT